MNSFIDVKRNILPAICVENSTQQHPVFHQYYLRKIIKCKMKKSLICWKFCKK